MEKNNIIAIVVVTLVVGIIVGYYVGTNNVRNYPYAMGAHWMLDGSMMGSGEAMVDMMEDMNRGLRGKEGDDFDKSFLSEMTAHHYGAVEMAQAALRSAKHQEIKSMANDIISAQTKEIDQMRGWLKSWYNQ